MISIYDKEHLEGRLVTWEGIISLMTKEKTFPDSNMKNCDEAIILAEREIYWTLGELKKLK